MAKKDKEDNDQLKQIAEYILYSRREAILNQWRLRCANDAGMDTRNSFGREEFYDQMPVLLNILGQWLMGKDPETDPVERAGQHGLHRWQRGYSLKELTHELANFYDILAEEIKQYVDLYPDTRPQVIIQVHGQLLRLVKEATTGSVLYYDQLRQTSAAEQAQTLQHTLDQVNELSRQRGEHLRQTSHDLRASFGVLFGAATLLKMPAEADERDQYVDMLNRNLGTIQHMLHQMTDHARLEAGLETVDIKSFDAAKLLRDIVDSAQGFAHTRKLILRADGPDHLPVVSDPVKVQRIVQNLLVNALKYTHKGSVSVSWSAENETRWLVSVQDTGPGLSSGPVGLLATQLKPLSEPTSIQQPDGPKSYPSSEVPDTQFKQKNNGQSSDSEGIGLFVVKRLCEFLKASMDIETTVGHGTLIRIRFLNNQESPESVST
ncbi:sensor histidine kinase [Spirosoma fluviale]|uniref:histidine kinase n=1 Tax=Spirosoma fluviale TaxID=1597977 RepID=A0A286G4L0_9BACT|nr:HAMP domain-containing sensor histidine kinase [Spirosoma fluviale]SOD90490.1 Signal transduction histidine kinase [Spirosoma fluviale]